MNKLNLTVILSAFLFSLLFVQEACKKKEDEVINDFAVNLPRYHLTHDVYYSVNPEDRSLELEFNQPLDPVSVDGNLSFYDKSGALDDRYTLEVSGNMILLVFKRDFQLKDGWQYFIKISPGLKSANGQSLAGNGILEIRTLTNPLPASDLVGTDSVARNSIAIISDLHLGDARASENHYCWFGKNKAALESFLDYVVASRRFKKLVILGDLFDEWLVPYTVSPFDPQLNINSTSDYFHAVVNNPVNTGIISRLKAIALNDKIELIYVPGNHDMLMTREMMEELIPNTTWAGKDETPGLGYYSPTEEIIMEHGHRYDFFNCPQSLVNPGHELPPGYFVSRLYAQGMMDQGNILKSANQTSGSFEFKTAWTLAYLYTIAHFDMPLPQDDSANILMGGIDDYSNPMSFNGAKKMYAENIEELWPETQTKNKVPVPTECCFHAIWNGHSDLWSAAMTQYILQPPAPVTYKVIAFGHTHQPELKTYVAAGEILNVYANSGSWLDEDASDYKVRTFLTINPAAWTGSQLDVVSLYQYNSSGAGQYTPVLLGEESVEAN